MTLSDERGRFDLSSVPPGDYFLLAADTRPTAPPDDERLAELLRLATRITLGTDVRKEVRLRLVAWPY